MLTGDASMESLQSVGQLLPSQREKYKFRELQSLLFRNKREGPFEPIQDAPV
jgi:hypothetical protein